MISVAIEHPEPIHPTLVGPKLICLWKLAKAIERLHCWDKERKDFNENSLRQQPHKSHNAYVNRGCAHFLSGHSRSVCLYAF